MTLRPTVLLAVATILATALLMPVSPALANAWAGVEGPAPEPVAVHGRTNRGCMAGGVALPMDGPGFSVMRPARNRYWGTPGLVALVEELGRQVEARGLGTMRIGDLAQPRGGPMPSGHASHQTGLDADIFYVFVPPGGLDARVRANGGPVPVLRAGTLEPDAALWGDAQRTMLRLAADLPGVDRIFVNYALKRDLCRTTGSDRAWLRRIRPWVGHDGHFHIRLACPAGQTGCVPQDPVPPGDGCGAELDSWFAPPPPGPAKPPAPKPPPPPMPAECATILRR